MWGGMKRWLSAHSGALRRVVIYIFGVLLIFVCLFSLFYAWVMWAWAHPPETSHRAVLVDVDNDGDLDAALANGINEGRAQNTLWINQGGVQGGVAGTFTGSSQRLGDAEFRDVSAGDLDSDGDADLVFGITWGELRIFMNQGGVQGGATGQYLQGETLRGAEYWGGTHPIGLADLDRDGDTDIFSGNCCGGMMMHDNAEPEPLPASVAMWTNETQASSASNITSPLYFRQQVMPVDNLDGTEALALGDLDGDGDLDAFMAKTTEQCQDNDYIRLSAYRAWWNDGAGNFTIGQSKLEAPSVLNLALGDLDGDGDLDALAGTMDGAQVLLNQGGRQGGEIGQYAILPETLGSQFTNFVFLGDLDADGDLDALLGTQTTASIWRNDGFAGFRKTQDGLGYSNRHALALGDVDNDGDLDLFTARMADDYLVWRNDGKGHLTR